jgi:hypothetical protein
MKIVIIAVILFIAAMSMYAEAQEDAGRYRFYSIKSGNNDLALLLDCATGKNWQVFVDSTGKVTRLSAITVEGVAYAPKDAEQLYSKVQSANIEGLSTSDTASKAELDKSYGYGLDVNELVAIRDKVKASALSKR